MPNQTSPATIRIRFVEWVSLLANPSSQLNYEKAVPFAPAYIELIETFYDLYWPADAAFVVAFTLEETAGLAELERLLAVATASKEAAEVHSVAELHELPEWRQVIKQAQAMHQRFEK